MDTMNTQDLGLMGEIHTDLALEAREMFTQRGQGQEPPGVGTETERQGDTNYRSTFRPKRPEGL